MQTLGCMSKFQDRVVHIIGRRAAGKSHLLRDILYHMSERFHDGVAFTTTKMFGECMNPDHVLDSFRPDVLENMVRFQRQRRAMGKTPIPLFCVLDDCFYSASELECPVIREIMINGRALSITLLVTTSYLMSPHTLCANVHFTLCMKEDILCKLNDLWNHGFAEFKTIDEFITTMDQATLDHGVLGVDHGSGQSFGYRAAPIVPTFSIDGMAQPAPGGPPPSWQVADLERVARVMTQFQ
jgi:hypothetical protein